jgi:hypothetical protein
MVRYTRKFEYGDYGSDVEGVARALCRAGAGPPLVILNAVPLKMRRTWGRRKQAWLVKFKRRMGIPATPVYGVRSHNLLSPYFDARARNLMNTWQEPVKLVQPKQGFASLHRSLWESYSIGRGKFGLSDLGTYNGASTLPSGSKSDHAYYPAYAFDLGVSPATGFEHPAGRRFFYEVTRRPETSYVILGNKIWSLGRGLNSYSYGGHENHVHVSGLHESYLRELAYKVAA